MREGEPGQRPSPDSFSDGQGFRSIPPEWEEAGGGDSKDSTSSSLLLWSRVEELPDALREKMVSLREERYGVKSLYCYF